MILAGRIYAERDELNRKLLPLLAAQTAQPAPALSAALAQLKANLSAEMRAVSEQHFLVFRMLLSTTQVLSRKLSLLSHELTSC